MKIIVFLFIIFPFIDLFAQTEYSCYVDINVQWLNGNKSKIRLTNKKVAGKFDTGVLLEKHGSFDYVDSIFSTSDLEVFHEYYIEQDKTMIYQVQNGTDYHRYQFINKNWWSSTWTPYASVILDRHLDSNEDYCFNNRPKTEYIPSGGEFNLIIKKNDSYHYPYHYCVKCPL